MLKQKIYRKIFLVGNKSFLQENLYKHLNNYKNLKKINFNKIFKIRLSDEDLVINFSNHVNFYKKKYNKIYDRNLILSKYLHKTKTKFIMISTRQVYKPKMMINENSKIFPISVYAKNSFISEKNCKKILKSKLLVLRLSNIIGFENKKKKRPSLMSIIINGYKKGIIEFDQNFYFLKDLLPIKHFSEIMLKIIKSDLKGTYNVGSGKSIKVNQFVKKILGKKKVKIKILRRNNIKDNNFSINTVKLFSLIKYTFTKKMLINEINSLKKKFNNKL